MRNIQISEDLFTDLLIYFGVQTGAEPTEYRRQQIHDALALKVQAMNNRVRYKQHLGYEGQTCATNAPVLPIKESEDDVMENVRLDGIYTLNNDPSALRSFVDFLRLKGFTVQGAEEVITRFKNGQPDREDINLWRSQTKK